MLVTAKLLGFGLQTFGILRIESGPTLVVRSTE
jgi:hypothetical protein